MRYLLSNGRITSNQLVYIKDMILINMTLLKDDVPYFNGGSDKLISDIIKDNIPPEVNKIVSDVLDRVRLQFPKLKISLVDPIFRDPSTLTLTIQLNINGNIETYDIKGTN